MFESISLFGMNLQTIIETNLYVEIKLKFSNIRIKMYILIFFKIKILPIQKCSNFSHIQSTTSEAKDSNNKFLQL